MRQTQVTSRSRAPHLTLQRVACAHRFEVAQIGNHFIPDLWVCQNCGQCVRRRSPKSGRNA